MAQVVHETHKVYEDNERNNTNQHNDVVDEPTSIAAKIVSIIGGLIMGVLALRFILSLLGANRDNAFADLVYGISYPFAAPFFGLFGYTPTYGDARLEFETLFAIGVYALLTWLITRLLTVADRRY